MSDVVRTGEGEELCAVMKRTAQSLPELEDSLLEEKNKESCTGREISVYETFRT